MTRRLSSSEEQFGGLSQVFGSVLVINNQVDRFSIAMDVIARVPKLQAVGAHAKEKFRNEQIDCCRYAYEHGINKPEIVNWKWPY